MKVVLFIFLILSFNSLASDIDVAQVAQNLKRSAETFKKECVNEDDSINNKKIMPSTLVSCADEQVFIQNQADLLRRNLDNNLQDGDTSICSPVVEEEEIGFLTGLMSKTTKKVNCKDRDSYKGTENCGKNLLCNGLRSILQLDKTLPTVVRKPIRSYIAEKGESIAPNCLAEGEPDCISELVTSLIGSLVETGKAIWNMLGATVDTLFSPSKWFDSASDKLHAASQASFKTVKKFIRNPGKWLFEFFDNITTSTEKWIKSGILCQKWKGTPHMPLSECVEPLESFSCLDCEDSINAVCSAVGVIASEIGIMALTAGTGTIASIGAKVGAKAFGELSKKAALKIKQKTPKLAGNIMARVDNKYVKGTVKYTAGAVKATHKALLASIDNIMTKAQKMKETKTVAIISKASKKVADTLADPSGLATKVAKGTILRTALVIRKSENKDVKKFADDEVKLAKAARDNGGDDKKAFKDRAQVRPLRTTVKIAESKFKTKPNQPNGNSGNDHPDLASGSGGNHGGNDHSSPKGEQPAKTSKNTELAEVNPKKDSHSGPNDDDNDGEANQSPVPRGSGVVAFSGNPDKYARYTEIDRTHKPEMSKTKKTVIGALAAVDMGMKVSGGAEEFDKAQEAQEQEYANSSRGFDNPLAKMGAHGIRKSNLNAAKNITAKKDINSDDDLKEVLGLSSENSTQQMRDQAQAKVAQLANVYSEENRQNMVSAITNSERGITAEQANHIFNERQQQVIAAKKYMTNVKAQDASPQRNVVSHNRPAAKVHSNINQYKGAIDSYFAGKKAGQAENETTRVLEDEIKALKEELKSPVKVTTKETKNAPSMVVPNVSPKGNVKVATRAPASVTSRPATNSGVSAQAPSSFFSSTPSISQIEEEDNFDHLGTLHPDVIAKNESRKNKDEAKAENIERKPASFSYKDFVAGATGEQSTPKKVNTLQSVAVDLKEIDFSQTEKDHATKFKKLLKEYRVATLVEHYELNGKQYIIYRFLNGESFGAIKRKNGGQTLINQSELANVIGL